VSWCRMHAANAGPKAAAATLTRPSPADPPVAAPSGHEQDPGCIPRPVRSLFFIWLVMAATVPWAAADYVGLWDIPRRRPLVRGTAERVGPWYDANPGKCALPSGHGPAPPAAAAAIAAGALGRDRLRGHGTDGAGVRPHLQETADLRGIPYWASPAVLAVTVLPAAFRRYWPRTVLALTVAGGAVATAVSRNPDLPPLAVRS